MRGTVDILRRALRLFSARGARFLGAAVAFYALLSAGPLFVLVLGLVGRLFGRPETERAMWSGLARWLAPEGVATLAQITARFERAESTQGILGVVLVVYGSTRLFRALRRSLNQLWGIDLEAAERERTALHRYGWRYGASLALAVIVAGIVALLVLEKTAFALVATAGIHLPGALVWTVDLGTSMGLAFLLFTALFRVLPETDITLPEAMTSAFVSTLLFALGSTLVTLYVRHKHLDDVFAGAGAVVLALVWVYYSAQVFFFGACIGAARRDLLRATAPDEQDDPPHLGPRG